MKLKHVNFDEQYDENKVVTNHLYLDKKEKFSEDGLLSEAIFGSLVTGNEYMCKCGKYNGKYHEGVECPECETEVIKTESNVEKIGWIDLNTKIINYIFFKQIRKIIGTKHLNECLSFEYRISKEGAVEMLEPPKNNPYAYKGMDYFYENFEEILTYFNENNNKDTTENYNYVMKNKEFVFIDKIPVISVSLRPAIMIKDTLRIDDVTIKYAELLKESKVFISKVEGQKLDIIVQAAKTKIQKIYNSLCDLIVEQIRGKDGFIRNNIMGSRINFSARCVITPNTNEYKMDEIVLPYIVFLELYKYEIINIIKTIKNISLVEAHNIWFDATLKIDPEIYDITLKMITDYDLRVILNRNPTINYGSIMVLKVKNIKKDYSDVTASISNLILSPLGADYDGDVLNIISIKDHETILLLKNIFEPTDMIISKNDNNFNFDLSLDKDQVVGIFSLNN